MAEKFAIFAPTVLLDIPIPKLFLVKFCVPEPGAWMQSDRVLE